MASERLFDIQQGPAGVPSPLVTVVIPTFNSADTVERALESIYSQDVSFFLEILVFDDASSDNTVELVERSLLKSGFSWKIIRSAENLVSQGISFLPMVMEQIRGRYIARLDADDEWKESRKLENQVRLLEANPDVDICGTGWELIHDDGLSISVPNIPGEGERIPWTELLRGNFLCHSSMVFRAQAVRDLPSAWARLPIRDYGLWALLSAGKDIAFHRSLATTYYSSPNSQWMSKPLEVRLMDELETVLRLSKLVPDHHSRRLWKKRHRELQANHLLRKFKSLLGRTHGTTSRLRWH